MPPLWALALETPSRWNNWEKMYALSGEEWVSVIQMVKAYKAGKCGVSEAIPPSVPCPDAPKYLNFQQENPDQKQYALDEADNLLPAIRENALVVFLVIIAAPYVLVPTINWVDGLVGDSDDDPLNIRKKLK